MPFLYRDHHDDYAESMATVRTFDNNTDFLSYLIATVMGSGETISGRVITEPYGPEIDERNGWKTHAVKANVSKGEHWETVILGYTDGPVRPKITQRNL